MILSVDLENNFFLGRMSTRSSFISCTQPVSSRTIDEFMSVTHVYNYEIRQCTTVDIQSARISVK